VAISAAFRDHVADLFARFGEIKLKSMFGGAGIYHKDQMFALIMDDHVYLKGGDEMRAAFEKLNVKPFVITNSKGERVSTSYFEMPEHLLDDPDEVVVWARRAYDAAIAARARKRKPTKSKLPRDLPLVTPKRKKK
jgi:DNA transformation protein